MTSTAVARTNRAEAKNALTAKVESAADRITPFLPDGITFDRVLAKFQWAIARTPKLSDCLPESVILSVAKICDWDLEIDETAFLVPRNITVHKGTPNEKRILVCQAMRHYMGDIELAIRAGVIRDARANCVYANERFIVEDGLHQRLEHQPAARGVDRGALIGAYAVYVLPGRESAFHYMPLEDIDALRKQYSESWANGVCPPWYAKKTVIRQGLKTRPRNPKLAALLTRFDEEETEVVNGALLATGEIQRPANVDADGVIHDGETVNVLPAGSESEEDDLFLDQRIKNQDAVRESAGNPLR